MTRTVISDVRLVSAGPQGAVGGLLGYVAFTIDGVVRVNGLTLRRTLSDRLALSFPARRDSTGQPHPYPHAYEVVRDVVEEVFSETNLQLWHPDAESEGIVYERYAANDSGETLPSIQLPEGIQEFRSKLSVLAERVAKPETFSCVQRGTSLLLLIASRHFRTPLMPFFWRGGGVASKA